MADERIGRGESGDFDLPVEPPELMATDERDDEVEAHGEFTLPVEPPELS